MGHNTKPILFRVQRYDPEQDTEVHCQEFVVPVSRGMTVLDGLLYIKENLDSGLAFRCSCRMSICGSCAMFVNGYPRLACHTQIEDLHSRQLTVSPLPNMPIIKDLVSDLSSIFAKHKLVKPYLIRYDTKEMEKPTAEYAQRPEDLNSYVQFSCCVKCGICVSACPTSASDKLFLGPLALAQCYRYYADNRDAGEQERFTAVSRDHGVWNCHLAGACSEACPKGVDPALGIQLLKRHIISQVFGLQKKQSAQVVPPPTETKPKVPFPEFTTKRDT